MTRPICTDPITDEEIAAIVRERIEEGADLALARGTGPLIARRPNGDAFAMVCLVIPAALIAATRAAQLEYDDDGPTGETVVLDEATLDATVEQARAAVAARPGGAA